MVRNTEAQKREMDALIRTNSQYASQLVLHEKQMNELSHNLAAAREQVKRLEVSCAALQTEKELLKAAEKRLLDENSSLAKERSQQQTLLSNLQHMLQTKEKSELEQRSRLSTELDFARSEW